MLELVLSKLITHYLKEYIQKIDSSQMEMKIWKGHASFDNLDLLATAFSAHKIPLLIKRGTIGHVDLNFPWKKLNTEACVVEIKDVYIVCSLDGDVLIQKDLQATEDAIHLDNAKKDFTKEDAQGTWQSLTNTVIDNARIDIENIHFRIEIPCRNSNVSLGFIIPKITMHTVDQNNKQIKVIKRFQVLRKLLTLERLSIYFDIYTEPVDLGDNFFSAMVQLMGSDWPHQYVMSPLTIECLLIHTRNNPNAVQNQLEVLTKEIIFSLDFLQCRAIIDLNERWKRFSIQRKYAHCLRPINFNSSDDNWIYAHRCAISRAFPHIFKPKLAMTILTHRKKYLKAYRKLHNDTKNPLIKSLKVFDPSLEKLENKIGPQASLFLRQFAEAVTRKESKENDTSLSALDMSELKGLINSTDQFFKSSSFSVSWNIPSFKLGLNYSIDQPLFTINFIKIIGELKSTEKEVTILLKITDLEMNGYFNEQIKHIFNVNLTVFKSFFELNSTIPTSTSASVVSVNVAPFMINLDTDALNNTATFFTNFQKAPGQSENQEEEDKVVIFLDIAEQFQKLTAFKNYSMIVNFNEITTVFPFVHNEENTELRLEISKIIISKELNEVIQPDAPSFNMNFNFSFTINQFQFAGLPLISSFTTHFLASITFFQRSTNIDVKTKFVLDDLAFYMMNFDYHSVMDTIHTILTLEIFNLSAPEISSNSKTVMSFARTQFDFQLLIKEFMIQLKDDKNDTKVYFRDISNKSAIFKTMSEFSFLMKSLCSVNNDVEVLNLKNDEKCCEIDIKKSDCQIHIYNSDINLDFAWIQWFQRYIYNFYTSIISEDISSIKEVAKSKSKDDQPKKEDDEENEETVIDNTNIQIILHDSQFIYKDPSGDVLFPSTLISVSSTENGYLISTKMFSIKHKNLLVLSPNSFNVEYKSVENKSGIISDFPKIAMQVSPSAYHAMLRFIYDLKDYSKETLKLLADDEENSSDSESLGLYKLVFDGMEVEAFENGATSSLAQIQSTKLVVEVQYDSKSLSTVVSMDDFDAQQQFLDGKIGLCAFDQFKFTYRMENDSPDQLLFDLLSPKKDINVRFPIITYVNDFISQDEYDKPSDSNYQYKIGISLPQSRICLFGKAKKIFYGDFGKTNFDCFLSNDNEYQLSIDSISLYALTDSLNEIDKTQKFLELNDMLSFSLKNNLISFHQPQIDMAFNLPSLYEIVDILSSELMSPNSDEVSSNQTSSIQHDNQTIPFGFDISIEKIHVKVLPQLADPHFFMFDFYDLQFVLKMADEFKFSSLFIKLIEVGINDKNLHPTKISEIRCMVSFNNTFDPTTKTHESIAKLEHQPPKDPFAIKKIASSISLKSIVINYSHRVASAVIACFVPPPQEDYHKEEEEESKKQSQDSKADSSMDLLINIKGELDIIDFKIVLWLLEPIATLNIIGFSATRTDKWNGMVKQIEISSEKNSLLRSKNNKNLFNFYKEKKAYYVVFNDETEIYFDDRLILQLTSYIMWSPLLHIPLTASSEEPTDIIALPFNLILFVPKVSIIIPTKFNSSLHIEFSLSLKIIEETFQASILSLSAYFSNLSGKSKYTPMLEDFSVNLIRRLENPTSVSINFSLSNVQCIISALDISIFSSIYESILKTYQSLTFSIESSSSSPSGLTDITFTSGLITLIICRDNRSSQRFDPLFKFSVPPVSFVLNLNNNSDNGNIAFEIHPYIQYFNETTGKWDMIVEPFLLRSLIFLQHQVLNFAVTIDKGININLPTTAIIQYMNLFNDIDASLSRNDVKSMNFPRFWIQNCLEIELDAAILPASKNEESHYFSLLPGQAIPAYHVKKESYIQIIVRDEPIEIFTPEQIVYPTYFSNSICICKRPYKGGILIQVNSSVQMFNGTSMKIDLFVRSGKNFSKYASIDSNQKYPLMFIEDKPLEFIVAENGDSRSSHKFQVIKISPNEKDPVTFPFWHGDRQINLIKVMSADSVSGTKIVLILPSVVAINNLPIPIYISYMNSSSSKNGDNDKKEKQSQTIEIKAESRCNLLFIEPECDFIDGKLSLDMVKFVEMTSLKFSKKNEIQSISVFDSNVETKVNIAVIFELDKSTGQTSITFFSPVVFFNMTKMTIQVFEDSAKAKKPHSITIMSESPGLWCPLSYMSNSSCHSVNILIPDLTLKSDRPLDCSAQGRSVIFLNLIDNYQMSTPLRYNITKSEMTTIVTFSSFLIVKNELELPISLQSILSIPKLVTASSNPSYNSTATKPNNAIENSNDENNEKVQQIDNEKVENDNQNELENSNIKSNDAKARNENASISDQGESNITNDSDNNIILTDNDDDSVASYETENKSMYSVASHSMTLGDRIKILPGESVNVEAMTLSGSFLLSVQGYSTTPALSLISQQKAAFRIISQNSFSILELEVSDTKTSMVSCIRRRNFPTPFLIANCLDAQLEAYHLIPFNPFVVEPHSTSIYAFDEPFSYPSLHIDIKNSQVSNEADSHLNISLVDDCDTMILDGAKLNGKPILLTIRPTKNGSRVIYLTQETLLTEKEGRYYWFFSISVDIVRISIIDLLMREFALITLNKLSAEFHAHYGMRVVKFDLDVLQIDDQHPFSQCPVVLHGRKCGNLPFFHFDATSPIGSLWMDNIFYVNATFQRIDAALDASFISDCFQMAKGLLKPIETAIAPAQARIKPSESTVHINWLEISPIYIRASFKGGYSKRQPLFGPIPWYIKLLPSINSAHIILPGIIIAHHTDRLKETREKVTGDYKSAAFIQILSILGISGRLMQSFGISDAIMRILHIRLRSDLVDISEASNAMIAGDHKDSSTSLASFEDAVFDNRTNFVGPFSHHSLSLIFGKLESLDMKVSKTIHNILTCFEQNNASGMQEIGIKLKVVPGCGFGYGVFGIITKSTINPMSNIPPMAGVSISRMPRAYPNGHIGKYSLFLSKAQAVIMKKISSSASSASLASPASGESFTCDTSITYISTSQNHVPPISDAKPGDNSIGEFTGFVPVTPISVSLMSSVIQSRSEKIRMKFRCTMTQNFVCITDSNIFVLNPTAEKIVAKLQFKEIDKVSTRNCQIIIDAKKKKKSILCSTAKSEKALRVSTFIKSQIFMAQMFNISLLE